MTEVWQALVAEGRTPADDVSGRALRSRETEARRPSAASEPSSGAPALPPRAAPASEAAAIARTFDSIGRRREKLRDQLGAIETAFANIESIRGCFHEILSPIDHILAEIEGAKTAHFEAERKLEDLRDAHDRLKGDHAALTVRHSSLSLRHDQLAAQMQELELTVKNTTAALAEARSALIERNSQIENLDRELVDGRRRVLAVSEQLPGLRVAFHAKEKRLEEVEAQRSLIEHQFKMSARENQSLRARLDELIANGSKLNRQLSELEVREADAARHASEFEAALVREQQAHAKLRNGHFEDAEAHKLEIDNLGEDVNSLTVRAEGAERLLAEARGELRERNAMIRGLEQRGLENALALQSKDKTRADLEHDLSTTRAQVADLEAARAALHSRSDDLIMAIEARSRGLERAEQRTEHLQAQLAEHLRLAEADREARDDEIRNLRERLDTEASARAFAEGALQSVRQERVALTLGGGSPPKPPLAVQWDSAPDKVTRLRFP
jgi:chromosome segregation ATPase